MTTTSTIEPVTQRLAQEKSLFELDDWDQALVPRFSGVVYLDAAGSARGHRIAVPDDLIRRIHGVSGRPMIIRVLSQQMRMGSYPGHENSGGSHTSGFNLLYLDPQLPDDSVASTATIQPEWFFDQYTILRFGTETTITTYPAVQEFAAGVDGVKPSAEVVEIATRLVQAALDHTADSEISVDVDGALSFVLQLNDGRLVLAELNPDGAIDASQYDDEQGTNVKRFPRATAEDLMKLF